METKLYKVYEITFPKGDSYVGSTSSSFSRRYITQQSTAKRKQKLNKTLTTKEILLTQYGFDEISMVEVDRIECVKDDPQIRMLEEKWKNKLSPNLNIYKAYTTKEQAKQRDKKTQQEYYLKNKKTI